MSGDLLTTDEVAQVLRVSRKTVLRLVGSGQLRAFKVGRAWRIRRCDVPRSAAREAEVVYLDDNASNPVHPKVREVMADVLAGPVGNASSAHLIGTRSRELIEGARADLAQLVGARSSEVVFTSGATEANNLILRGLDLGRRPRLLVSAGEHASVMRVAQRLAACGVIELDVIPLCFSGEPDLGAVAAMMDHRVGLISVVAANSETGVLSPISNIVDLARKFGAKVHCDATQWVGRLAFSMFELDVDAISVSAHKMSGPQGVGALIARRALLRQLEPQALGGGHEQGLRSGTHNVAGIAGFGMAATLAADPDDGRRVLGLRDRLEEQLIRAAGAVRNGSSDRLPNTSNLHFPGVPGDALLARTPSVAASLGSACHSGAIEPSATLLAMGLEREAARESVRFSVSRFTTPAEIDRAAGALAASAEEIRSLSEKVVEL